MGESSKLHYYATEITRANHLAAPPDQQSSARVSKRRVPGPLCVLQSRRHYSPPPLLPGAADQDRNTATPRAPDALGFVAHVLRGVPGASYATQGLAALYVDSCRTTEPHLGHYLANLKIQIFCYHVSYIIIASESSNWYFRCTNTPGSLVPNLKPQSHVVANTGRHYNITLQKD